MPNYAQPSRWPAPSSTINPAPAPPPARAAASPNPIRGTGSASLDPVAAPAGTAAAAGLGQHRSRACPGQNASLPLRRRGPSDPRGLRSRGLRSRGVRSRPRRWPGRPVRLDACGGCAPGPAEVGDGRRGWESLDWASLDWGIGRLGIGRLGIGRLGIKLLGISRLGGVAGTAWVRHETDTVCRSSINHLPPTSRMVTWNRFWAAVASPCRSHRSAGYRRRPPPPPTCRRSWPSRHRRRWARSRSSAWSGWSSSVILFACHWVALVAVSPDTATGKSGIEAFQPVGLEVDRLLLGGVDGRPARIRSAPPLRYAGGPAGGRPDERRVPPVARPGAAASSQPTGRGAPS